MEQFSFEKLDAYKQARNLVIEVYKLLEKFPISEKYALCDQLRRAIISVPSNIAEGSGRMSIKEKIHFLEIAFGSLMEAYCQLQIAVDLNYIWKEDLSIVNEKIIDVSKLLSGLRKSLTLKL